MQHPDSIGGGTFFRPIALALILIAGLAAPAAPAADAIVPLSKPRMTGGKPILQALKERQSIREFKPDALPPEVLSDLLWAACGINRATNDHRTAPSAMNSQEVDLYLAKADGLFLYEPKAHQLRKVLDEDLRAKTTGQAPLRVAPVAVILVADHARLIKARPEMKDFYGAIDAGFISQNIYLFCASEGLATVVHDLDRAPLAQAMKLRPDQKVVIAQAVGLPIQ